MYSTPGNLRKADLFGSPNKQPLAFPTLLVTERCSMPTNEPEPQLRQSARQGLHEPQRRPAPPLTKVGKSRPHETTGATPTLTTSRSDHALQSPPTLRISDGTLEAIKWLALALMTADHINKYLLHEGVPALYAIGRVAMPLFVFVLAYNLARPNAFDNGSVQRSMRRLLLAGVVASVPYAALGVVAGWWPLNILFTLLASVTIIALLHQGGARFTALAAVVFLVAGAVVEFWWPALALGVACWAYVKRPTPGRLALVAMALVTLAPINRNLWTLLALPVIVVAHMYALLLVATPDCSTPTTRCTWRSYGQYARSSDERYRSERLPRSARPALDGKRLAILAGEPTRRSTKSAPGLACLRVAIASDLWLARLGLVRRHPKAKISRIETVLDDQPSDLFDLRGLLGLERDFCLLLQALNLRAQFFVGCHAIAH